MDSPHNILQLATSLVVASAVIVGLLAVWAINGRIPTDVTKKYSPRVVARSAKLFAEDWRAFVEPPDMPLFLKARFRRMILNFALIVLISHVPLAYGFLQSMADAWQCHLDSISWSPMPPKR